MSERAAGEEKLGGLHSIVSDTLIEQLEGTPILNEDGDEIGRHVDPRIIASAITFLNNNKIVANPFLSEKMSEIEAALKKRATKFRVLDAEKAAKRAADAL